MATPEVEVFRLSPEVGKCYKHAEYTRKTGRYPNERYFYNGTPKYVGKFVKTLQYGYGDGASIYAVFNDNGVENRVTYSYGGQTSFIEVPCEEPSAENKAKKTAALNEFKVLPSTGTFPGGPNFRNAKNRFSGKTRRNRRLTRHRK